jgi:Mrp family chromosome partitioning ATPase
MTTTDQAFIRAYTPANRPSQATAGNLLVADALSASVQFVMANLGVISSEQPGPGEADRLEDSSISRQIYRKDGEILRVEQIGPGAAKLLPAPHISICGPEADPGKERPTPNRGTSAPNTATSRPTLASVMAPQQTAESNPDTSVATFHLPKICEQLLSDHADQLTAAVDTISRAASEGRSVVTIVGSEPQVGCTTVLLCLARQLTAQGKSVVVVDANFQNPQLATALGIYPTTTWQDMLDRGAPLAEALVRSSEDGLTLLPSANRWQRPSAEQIGLQASVTAGALRYEYEIVLIDLGTMFSEKPDADTLQLFETMRIDASILVANANSHSDHERSSVTRILEKIHCPVLGVIENLV